MDGLANDADILFLLTTNRAEMLEPALASRPGRVDLAHRDPSARCGSRRRLFDLYRQGLRFEVRDLETIVDRTEGVERGVSSARCCARRRLRLPTNAMSWLWKIGISTRLSTSC